MKGKLGLILTLAVVGIIVVGTILLGVIKVDYSPKIDMPINSVQISKANEEGSIMVNKTSADKTILNDVVKLYENSFKQSVLASFFSGNANNQVLIEMRQGSYKSQTSNAKGHKITFALTASGISIAETDKENQEKVNELSLVVENIEGFETLKIYGQIVGSTTNYIEISTKANVKALYDYISDIEL